MAIMFKITNCALTILLGQNPWLEQPEKKEEYSIKLSRPLRFYVSCSGSRYAAYTFTLTPTNEPMQYNLRNKPRYEQIEKSREMLSFRF